PPGVEPVDKPSFGRPNWFEYVAAEHRAVRERVALIDQTSFSKLEIDGPQALVALQRLAVSDMDKPVGSVIYTQLCNPHGGIACDPTFTRLAETRFYVVTGSAFGRHDQHWIESNIRKDGLANARGVTSPGAVINSCGPKARDVLASVLEEDVSNAAFP